MIIYERAYAFSGVITLHFVHFTQFHYVQSRKGIVERTSSVARRIEVDVIAGTCCVVYNNGTVYDYTNVSRRALFNLLNNVETLPLVSSSTTTSCSFDSKAARYGVATQLI